MSDSVVPAAPPDHTSGFAAKLLVLGLRASLAVPPRPTAWALRHLFAKSAAERGGRQLKDAPTDIVAVIDEPYDPSPDALLDMYVPGEAARSGTALPAVAQTHGGTFAGGSKDEIGGCSWPPEQQACDLPERYPRRPRRQARPPRACSPSPSSPTGAFIR